MTKQKRTQAHEGDMVVEGNGIGCLTLIVGLAFLFSLPRIFDILDRLVACK